MSNHNLPQPAEWTSTDPRTITDVREPDERPSWHVIEVVAAATGTDPTRMPPLGEVVDPEALDRLFEPEADRSRPDRVAFRFNGCDVAVYADGRTVAHLNDDRA